MFNNVADVRVVTLEGEPWFVAKDVAQVLGYADTVKAIKQHCKKHVTAGVVNLTTLDPQTKIIPESDVYRLIIKSRLPEAEKFEAWVMEEVLPSIRQHGGYLTPDKVEEARIILLMSAIWY